MDELLRVLYLVDNSGDTDRVRHALENGKRRRAYEFVISGDPDDFIEQLDKNDFDLIFAEPEVASHNGQSALQFAQSKQPDLPFIYISEAVSDDTVVKSLKEGAADFVFKNNLSRLGAAVERALSECQLKQERRQLENRIRESEHLHRTILSNVMDAVFVTDENGDFTYVCPNVAIIFGYSTEEVWKMGNIGELLGAELLESLPAGESSSVENLEQTVRVKSGTKRKLLVSMRQVDCDWGELLFTCHDITDREEAVEALQHSQEQLSTLIDNLPGIAYRCKNNRDYDMEFISDGCYELTGYPQSDFLTGKVTLGRLIHPEDRDAVYAQCQNAFQKNRSFELTYRIICANGEEKWVWERGKRSPRSKDENELLEGFITDITAQKQALEESQFQAHMLNSVEQAVIASHPDGTIFYWNDFAEKLYGWSKEEAIGKNIIGFTTQHVDDDVAETIMQQLRQGKSWSGEFQVKDKNGRVFTAHVSDTPILDDDGGLIALIGISFDLTEQKKTERALRQSEERFRLAVDHFPYTFVIYNAARRIQYINARGVEISGYTEDELIGRRDEELFPPEITDTYLPLLQRAVETKTPQTGECDAAMPDGTRYFFIVNYVPLLDEHGGIKQILGIAHDVSDQKKTLDALVESEEKYRSLFENSKDAIYISTPEGRFLDINPAGVELLGYDSKEELLSLHIPQALYVNPDDRKRFEQMLADAHYVKDFEVVLKRKNGERVHILETGNAVFDDNGNPTLYRGIMRNITRQKELERQILQMQKMEAVGTLAGGIAHDFNNILTAILGYAEVAAQELEGHPAQGDLREILNAGERASKLVNQILTFCHGVESKRQTIQVEQLVRETIRLLKATLPATIKIKQNIPEVNSAILGDPTQVHQVVMNLCTNAYHAMREKGGELSVSLCEEQVEVERPTITGNLEPNDYVVLTVEDTGHGMTSEVMAKIFDPFYTTKAGGEGSGMGLSVVHGIVKGHDGAISVESTPGEGSTFRVYLPVTHEREEIITKKAESFPTGTERILFVDDEAAIANLGRRMLETFGYRVTTVTNGVEALEEFRAQPDRFDLVITDQNMPQILGMDLAQKMMQIRSDIPIILVTGYSELIDKEGAKAIGIRDYIMKPFLSHEFGRNIRMVLDGEQSQARSD